MYFPGVGVDQGLVKVFAEKAARVQGLVWELNMMLKEIEALEKEYGKTNSQEMDPHSPEAQNLIRVVSIKVTEITVISCDVGLGSAKNVMCPKIYSVKEKWAQHIVDKTEDDLHHSPIIRKMVGTFQRELLQGASRGR